MYVIHKLFIVEGEDKQKIHDTFIKRDSCWTNVEEFVQTGDGYLILGLRSRKGGIKVIIIITTFDFYFKIRELVDLPERENRFP